MDDGGGKEQVDIRNLRFVSCLFGTKRMYRDGALRCANSFARVRDRFPDMVYIMYTDSESIPTKFIGQLEDLGVTVVTDLPPYPGERKMFWRFFGLDSRQPTIMLDIDTNDALPEEFVLGHRFILERMQIAAQLCVPYMWSLEAGWSHGQFTARLAAGLYGTVNMCIPKSTMYNLIDGFLTSHPDRLVPKDTDGELQRERLNDGCGLDEVFLSQLFETQFKALPGLAVDLDGWNARASRGRLKRYDEQKQALFYDVNNHFRPDCLNYILENRGFVGIDPLVDLVIDPETWGATAELLTSAECKSKLESKTFRGKNGRSWAHVNTKLLKQTLLPMFFTNPLVVEFIQKYLGDPDLPLLKHVTFVIVPPGAERQQLHRDYSWGPRRTLTFAFAFKGTHSTWAVPGSHLGSDPVGMLRTRDIRSYHASFEPTIVQLNVRSFAYDPYTIHCGGANTTDVREMSRVFVSVYANDLDETELRDINNNNAIYPKKSSARARCR